MTVGTDARESFTARIGEVILTGKCHQATRPNCNRTTVARRTLVICCAGWRVRESGLTIGASSCRIAIMMMIPTSQKKRYSGYRVTGITLVLLVQQIQYNDSQRT